MKKLFGLLIFVSSLSYGAEDTVRSLHPKSGDLIVIKRQMFVPGYDGYNQIIELSRKQNAQGEGCVLIAEPGEKKPHSFEVGHEYEVVEVKIEFDQKSKLSAFGVKAKNLWHYPYEIMLVCYSKFSDISLREVHKNLDNKIEIVLSRTSVQM